jgi:hypothetical protein
VGRFVLVFFGGLTHISKDVLSYLTYCHLSHSQSSESSSDSLPSDDSLRQQLATTAQLIKFIPSFQRTYHSTMTSISTLRGGEGGDSGDEWEAIMDLETAAVMLERVKESTREGYKSRNVSFMIWLFEGNRYHDLISTEVLAKMNDADTKDKATTTKKSKRSKKRTHLRTVCAESLTSSHPSDPNSHPLNLGRLSFAIFSRYLTTFKKSVAANKLQSASVEATEEEVDVKIGETATIRLASSSYSASCSALSYLFSELGISKDFNETTKELWTKLSEYNKGMRRVGGKEKRLLGLSTEDGKKPLPFAAYKYLAKVLFKSKKAEHVGAHAFLISYNLYFNIAYNMSIPM